MFMSLNKRAKCANCHSKWTATHNNSLNSNIKCLEL